MKKATNKSRLWYLGFVVCALILLLIALGDLPEMADVGLSVAFGAIFGLCWTQTWYNRQAKKDPDFEIEVEDERNVQIKYRAGYLTCGVDWFLLSAATVVLIILDYLVPAIITGVILLIQPAILIVASNIIEKKI